MAIPINKIIDMKDQNNFPPDSTNQEISHRELFNIEAEQTILGTIIGAFIMSVLINGLRIMSVAQEWQMVLTGLIIILAVYTDILRRKKH